MLLRIHAPIPLPHPSVRLVAEFNLTSGRLTLRDTQCHGLTIGLSPFQLDSITSSTKVHVVLLLAVVSIFRLSTVPRLLSENN